MNLKDELTSYTKLVEEVIYRYLNRDIDALYGPLKDLMSRGGKRIRPALCMLSCEAVGGKREDAVKAAAAIEMVHNFTLIHDDIADKSELRRGKSCLHYKYGLGLAINAGDGLATLANEAILDAADETDKPGGRRIVRMLAETVTKVSEGQALDISWVQDKRWDLTDKDYFTMIKRKTGELIATSCAIGAVIGGGTEKQINALRDFGMGLGVGFQIQDDVLNLRGDLKKYGKEIGGDINEGKRTLIIIYTLSACAESDRKRLIRILDKEKNSQEEIANAIEIINKYGSIERASRVAKEMIEESKRSLSTLPKSKAKDILLMMADYMVERNE